jgi:two-component system, cell cycle sensor histidine kinase and response regulator CckA
MRFLIIEGDPECREEIRARLKREFLCSAIREVDRESQLEAAVAEGPYDMVVTDSEPGWVSGFELIRRFKERWPHTPVVMVARGARETLSSECIRAGIDDCLISGHLDCLPFAVKESVERARLRKERDEALEARKSAEKRCSDLEAELARHIESRDELVRTTSELTAIFHALPDLYFRMASDGTILDYRAGRYSDLFVSPKEFLGKRMHDVLPADVGLRFLEKIRELQAGGGMVAYEYSLPSPTGGMQTFEARLLPLMEDQVVAIVRNISHKQAVEAQLRHAHKMEAIGQLAGGVAHDFNNILVAIIGFAELLMNELSPDSPLREDLGEIVKAADRGAGLARQLMAFSRKQATQVEDLDLNVLIAGLQPMLARLIGEDIELVTSLDPELGQVRADPGQIEQVIVNLALNARSAMPEGGVLTIETGNAEVDAAFSSQHVAVGPGRYVCLTVRDTGRSADEQTRALLSEPFPATNPSDVEVVHGLATVYGIVSQNRGGILINSRGQANGNAYVVYLPRLRAAAQGALLAREDAIPGGLETLLVVEDEESVRELARRILEAKGYTVLVARNGVEALEICRRYVGSIHLVLTDVIMPEMSGRQLADRLLSERPEIKVMFMSGYSSEIIVNRGVLATEAAYIEKPFRHEELSRKVRHALDGGR